MDFLVRVLRNALPHYFYVRLFEMPEIRRRAQAEQERLRVPLALASRNADLRNRHAGARCFILCNGPSVKRQNVRLLKGEHVISVSNGYHHADYAEFAPAYHCVPQLTYGLLTRADAIVWFREMHEKLGKAILFLNYTEEPLVREEGLFPGRDVRYVAMDGSFADHPALAMPDIAQTIPAVQSVPLMALMVAMYMGLGPIYLLGTDHDHFRTGEYKYFFEPTVLKGKDSTVDEQGRIRAGGWFDELTGLARLWGQYRSIKEIAVQNGVQIINATAGGELDEFPRADFDSLFSPVPAAQAAGDESSQGV